MIESDNSSHVSGSTQESYVSGSSQGSQDYVTLYSSQGRVQQGYYETRNNAGQYRERSRSRSRDRQSYRRGQSLDRLRESNLNLADLPRVVSQTPLQSNSIPVHSSGSTTQDMREALEFIASVSPYRPE